MAEQDPGAVGGSGDGEPGQLSAEHRAWPDDQANVWPGSGQRTWLESDEVWPDSNGQFWPGGEELWPAASPRGWPNEDAAAAEPDTGQPGGESTPGQPSGESTEACLDSLVAKAGTAVPAPADGAQPGLTEPGLSEPGLSEPGTGHGRQAAFRNPGQPRTPPHRPRSLTSSRASAPRTRFLGPQNRLPPSPGLPAAAPACPAVPGQQPAGPRRPGAAPGWYVIPRPGLTRLSRVMADRRQAAPGTQLATSRPQAPS